MGLSFEVTQSLKRGRERSFRFLSSVSVQTAVSVPWTGPRPQTWREYRKWRPRSVAQMLTSNLMAGPPIAPMLP